MNSLQHSPAERGQAPELSRLPVDVVQEMIQRAPTRGMAVDNVAAAAYGRYPDLFQPAPLPPAASELYRPPVTSMTPADAVATARAAVDQAFWPSYPGGPGRA